MVFGPMGIMQRDEVIESMREAPRWTDVEFNDRSEVRYEPVTVVLAYRARATRDKGGTYEAICTSTYISQGRHWRVAQHQQTPV
jgi:hypothetical protein